MSRVVLSRLSKSFGDGPLAVADVSLDVVEGEFVVLLGPSGSGKTTLLRLIAGLDAPDAGTVSIGGRDVTALPPRRRDVGLVFQRDALDPFLTVRQNLAFSLAVRRSRWRRWLGLGHRPEGPTPPGRAEIDDRVHRVASRLDVAHLLDRTPRELSGGERQRVALGRALVREPSVLLLDEPLANLDTRLREDLRRELAGLHRETGRTTILVTHDHAEAMALADRIVVLDRGTVQAVGRPWDLYDRPPNRFVATFLGTPGINLIPVRGQLPAGGEDTGTSGPPDPSTVLLPTPDRPFWSLRSAGGAGDSPSDSGRFPDDGNDPEGNDDEGDEGAGDAWLGLRAERVAVRGDDDPAGSAWPTVTATGDIQQRMTIDEVELAGDAMIVRLAPIAPSGHPRGASGPGLSARVPHDATLRVGRAVIVRYSVRDLRRLVR